MIPRMRRMPVVSASLRKAALTPLPGGTETLTVSQPYQGQGQPQDHQRWYASVSLCHLRLRLTTVRPARNLLCNMTHRGAVGSDARDGDGAGVMTSIPHRFFIKNFARETGYDLPPLGQYAAGNLFFKPEEETLKDSTTTFEDIAGSLGLRVIGWREVPRDSRLLGPAALSREPLILQPFVVLRSAYGDGIKPDVTDPEKFDEKHFERQLYVLRKRATHTIGLHNWFYLCSLSNKNIVYKGQLSPVQVYQYYHDLVSVDYEGHFALVHSRFSTNTFPSWDRAQPLRWAAHNGTSCRCSSTAFFTNHVQAKSIHCEGTRIGCGQEKASCSLISSRMTLTSYTQSWKTEAPIRPLSITFLSFSRSTVYYLFQKPSCSWCPKHGRIIRQWILKRQHSTNGRLV